MVGGRGLVFPQTRVRFFNPSTTSHQPIVTSLSHPHWPSPLLPTLQGWWPHAPTHADSGVAAHPGLSHNGAAAVLLTPGAAFAATGAAAAPTVLPAGLVASGIAVVLAGAVAFIGYRFVTAPPDDQAASSANAEHQGTATDGTQDTRQLLGLPAAAVDRSRPLWQVRLQLTKPMAWMPLICGVAAGAAASGNFHWTDPSDVLKVCFDCPDVTQSAVTPSVFSFFFSRCGAPKQVLNRRFSPPNPRLLPPKRSQLPPEPHNFFFVF